MADVALRPDFPEEELARLRKEALTDLLQARDEPGAHRLARARAGGLRPGPPLRAAAAGDAAPDRGFTVADLRAFHAAHFRPATRRSSWSGDVDPGVLQPLLEKAFGAWARPAGSARRARVPAPRQLKGRTRLARRQAGRGAVVIRIGRVGPLVAGSGTTSRPR